MASRRKENSSNTKGKIVVSKDGPYLVSGAIPLAEQIICLDPDGQCHGWREGKKYPVQENYSLCRCGHSKNMPYCDGTHVDIQFDGTETATRELYMEQANVTTGASLTLTDAQDFCASARFCHRAIGIWELTEQSADPAARQTAIEEAGDCPSGRLVVWYKNGKPIEPEFEPSIAVIVDSQAGIRSPLWVRGGILIESADGTPYEVRNRVTLCNCGKSANKPFCDSSHLGG